MNRAELSLDVIQSAHVCMAFVDAELFDLPEGDRPLLVEILESYVRSRRTDPTPRYTGQDDAGSRQTRLLLTRMGRGGWSC